MGFPDEIIRLVQIGHGPHPDKYICCDIDNKIWVLSNFEFLAAMSKPRKTTAEWRSIDPNQYPATSDVQYFLTVFNVPPSLNGSIALHPVFNLLWEKINKK